MSEKIVKYIVYLLSILIGIALFGVIYGLYINIYPKSPLKSTKTEISLLLNQEQKIKNMQVIDEDKILITIEDDNQIQGIIYDINKKKIIQRLNK